jgi:hypothetical protein
MGGAEGQQRSSNSGKRCAGVSKLSRCSDRSLWSIVKGDSLMLVAGARGHTVHHEVLQQHCSPTPCRAGPQGRLHSTWIHVRLLHGLG